VVELFDAAVVGVERENLLGGATRRASRPLLQPRSYKGPWRGGGDGVDERSFASSGMYVFCSP